MRALFTVFGKEFLENLRDRRTLLSALLLGPLLGPLLFGAMVSRMLDQSVAESDEPLKITLSGAEQRAKSAALPRIAGSHPGIIRALRECRPGGGEERRRPGGGHRPRRLRAAICLGRARPAAAGGRQCGFATRKIADRVRQLLANYGSGIAQLRLRARGVNPLLAAPVAVNEIDVATPTGRAVAVLGFMTYFVLFAVLMGGLYLAIDSTAGRARARVVRSLAQPAGRRAAPRRRQDPGDLRLHVPVARHQSDGLRVRVSFRAARAARHERQSRERARPSSSSRSACRSCRWARR